MAAWLTSLMSIEALLFAVPHLSLHIEPQEGSLAGGTWITIVFDGLEPRVLYPANGSQLEIHLVSVAAPALPSIPCDVSPAFLDLPVVMCQTRSLASEAHEGLYSLEVRSGDQVVSSLSLGPQESCTFKFSKAQTPVIYQVYPSSGVPGKLIHVYGWITTGILETFEVDTEYIDSPLILEAQGDQWVTPCSLINRKTESHYPIQEDQGFGTLTCRVEGDYIGSQNVSFSIFNKGKSVVRKDAWLISAKQDLFLYQTHSEILFVSPETGSLGGGTDITITGEFFTSSAQVTVAGIPCDTRRVSSSKIECTTRAPGKGARLSAPQAGNRGLLFEVGDAAEGLELTAATPGYRKQIVPNASSPFEFWSEEGQSFRARLSGFFVAPETNNYTFWIQADSQAALHLSESEEPRTKVKVASVQAGTADWFDSWDQRGSEGTWQQKSPKLELLGGSRYYLEAEHHGIAPSRGMKIGVQIHNTWLNPDVVTTYLREKHQILVRSQRLPEIQMLTVSGRGDFFLTWDNVSSQPIPANATAHQIQTTIEELLAVKCKLEPLSVNILLRLGFEQGREGSIFDGDPTSETEPFCGRFSLHQPRRLVLTPPDAQKGYRLSQYPYLCLAYKGHVNQALRVTVSFTSEVQGPGKKNSTCDWRLQRIRPRSWQFSCADLWDACVHRRADLQPLLASSSSVLVHRVVLVPLAHEMGQFYLDEVIVASTNVSVSPADSGAARPGGNLVESVAVVGFPPVFTVTVWMAGCGTELPIITARSVPTEGTEEESGLVQVTTQRLQRTSPPLGGFFCIQLSNRVIPDVPVHISAGHLHKLLQDNADDFTSRYLNVSDFTVKEDRKSCYEHVWSLSWSTQTGDLPNFIKVFNQNLTGMNPAAVIRVVYDGGVFLGPIFGDMLAAAHQHSQVVVRVNDIPAHCLGSCSFQYLQDSTPQVHSVWHSIDGDANLMVYITGTGFSDDSQSLQIMVNKTNCKVTFSNQMNVVCQTGLLPVGVHQVSVLVRPSGLAVNASGDDLLLRVEPRLDAVEPARAAEIGGIWATIRGLSLEGVSLVQFGSQSCAINVTMSNSQRIQCRVPPRGEDGSVVNVTVFIGDRSVVLPRAFMYASSLNPVIVSLSRNRSIIAGGETLFIGMSPMGNCPDLDVEIHIGGVLTWVPKCSPQGLEVVLPRQLAGLHNISVSVNGVNIHSQGVDLHIWYLTEVYSIEPCCGSLLGGTILSISGVGFGNDPTLVWVLVGNQCCDIVNVTDLSIWCETSPAPRMPDAGALQVTAPVEVWAGNMSFIHGPSPSLVGKGFTFTYEVAATPVVTAMWEEMTNSSLRLHVEGNNLSNSAILLGTLTRDLQTRSCGGNVSLYGCSFPLHSLEAGTYLLQVRHKQMGFANMSTAPRQFVVKPQVVSVTPTEGSLCGGTMLTVRGAVLKSKRRLIQVDLSGPFACVVLALGDDFVACRVNQMGDHSPGTAFTLNVTVLVNGLASECQGSCTVFVHEDTTPVVDALTIVISGSLATVVMRGQRLGLSTHKPMIFVDNHLPCDITFFNASQVACLISDLAPGLHYLSAFLTSNGYACWGSVSRRFSITPQVFHYFPKNFSIHGGSILTIEGAALRGRNTTSVYVAQKACLTVTISSELIQCIVPEGNGSVALVIEVDGTVYPSGVIAYSNAFTPELISVSQNDDILTFSVAHISGAENVDIFIGVSRCVGVSGNHTILHCKVPSLPAGERHVRGYDRARGWASSALVFTSRATVTAVTANFGCLSGRLVHVFGAGLFPGNTSAAVCGAPCQVLANATASAFSCLVLPLDVSLAFLCGLKPEGGSCEGTIHTYVQCELTVTVGTERLSESWPYLYICEESSQCLFTPDHWTEAALPSFSGLFVSPKVERDEVLIYNSSCNIAMETEAEMECEPPNQPITAKITEIRKSWGQNTQGNFSLQVCRRWSRTSSWFPEGLPQDGDNVTVEEGQLLLLDTNTSILNLLHIKGGKLVFMDSGDIQLRAHSILVSDGGELRIGSKDEPFRGKAQITLYGSSHSTPFFPYGVKFLAVRNGTLSLHGSLPEVRVSHLRAAAQAGDAVLALEDAVDWHPGDEVAIASGTGVAGARPPAETVIVESVHKADIHLRSPLRYSHNFTENWVGGEHHILKVTVALLSRRITIQGDLTRERAKFPASCQETSTPEDNLQHRSCFKSEKKLGPRNLGARVIIQSLPQEPSQVQLKGVQFRDVGQPFHKHLSSLTLVGAMRDSYVEGCTVWSTFSRGLSLCRTWGLKVDGNVFYKILGHALLVGTNMETSYIPWEVIPGRKHDWTEEGNIIRNNVIISVSGAEGLSSSEKLTPSGIYIRMPTNVIEGNRVRAAGYGYFFHLVTHQSWQAPLLSFAGNAADSCTRYGLFVYPKFQPPWGPDNGPALLHNFTVWGSAGGVRIFRSSNLHLKSFQVYSCRDFGIDILESDGNTSVTDSLLLGHFAHKKSLCMSAGIKTPKRWGLMISNTTFINFDLINCVAITTCSGCSQGQGGFTVTTNQLKLANSSNLVAFPFPNAAVLEDVDGSLSGKNRSHIVASMETLPASCLVNVSFSGIVPGSVCEESVRFHRMAIGLANAPDISYNLTVTDSRNKTITVNYVHDTLSNLHGWMALLLDWESYSLRLQNPWINAPVQYSATFDNFAHGNYLLLVHRDLPPHPDILIRCGSRQGQPLQSLPSPGQHQGCDWFFDSRLRQLTYLVSGESQVQVTLRVKEGVYPSTPASTSAPKSASRWSLPTTWQDVEEGWGGYNHTIPGSGDDVVILRNRTVLVDTDLPPLRGLYVMGTLEFPVDRSNVLSVACLLIAGGELKVGTSDHPLEKDQKFVIFLRASEGIFCDRFNGIHIDPGTIGVYGKIQLHSTYPKKSWTRLGADIASGNERIIVKDAVDWKPSDKIVLTSSSYEPHEAEVLTVKEVKGYHVRVRGQLQHRHVGSAHVLEDGGHIPLAAEVGLLTRDIQIQSDTLCRGRLLVGSFRKVHREEFSGVLQFLNVEIQNLGSPLYPSIEFANVSSGSRIVSSSLHRSCGGGIRASASHGIILNDNVVFGTVGHGIDLEGQAHSLSNNLVVLVTQSTSSTTWVAGIKVNGAKDVHLLGNVVAGSERIGFHVGGHRCSSEVRWLDNVAHSSLHGLHLYKTNESDNCTCVSGFLAFKNFDYGAMVHIENSVEMENFTLVDNAIGLLAVVCVSPVPQSSVPNVQIVLRNSVIVATSSSFDCIQDKIRPYSANLTSTDRAPPNPRGGRVGILWPVFTSIPNQWPRDPWHRVRNGPFISGIMKLQDVTFSSFVKSCYSDDLDICILPNVGSSGIMSPITAERTRMLKIRDKNKFYFPPLHPRKDFKRVFCPESDCESWRKYLFKDLDGKALSLPPPVSVFPKTEAQWMGSFFNTGTFREEQKCTYVSSIQGFICKQTDQVVLTLDSVDVTWTAPTSYPVVSVTSGFVDTFSSVNDNALCSPSGTVSTFYSILPIGQITKVCFVDQTPQSLHIFLLGNKSTSKLLLAVSYHELQSPRIFSRGHFIPPTPVQSASSLLGEPLGANYFSIVDNLLYFVLEGEEHIEIRTGVSLHLAFTVTLPVPEEDWKVVLTERLANFLEIGQNQIRLAHVVPGSEETLETIADSRAKRKRHCPTVACASHYGRVGQRRPLTLEMNSYTVSLPATWETVSKVVVVEIGDLPMVGGTEPISSLSSDKLQNLLHRVVTAQQTGVLNSVLNVTVGALLVTQANGALGSSNTSRSKTGNVIYVQPYTLSVLVQPSDGEVGKELPVQPQLVFLDVQDERVEFLGPPSEPWVVLASLEGTPDSVLRGCIQAETRDGYVRFSNLAVLISGSNWHFIFTVTSPPGANFTARSRPFAVRPAVGRALSPLLLATALCSVVSWLALSCLLCCWFKRSKNRKTKPEELSASRANDQKNCISVPSGHRGPRGEPEKAPARAGGDMKMKAMLGTLRQPLPQARGAVSRRKVNRAGTVPEEQSAVPCPSVPSVAAPRHTCAPQQGYPQEAENWKVAQEQLLRYQLAGQDQLLLLCPDLGQDRQSEPDRERDSLGPSQEKKTSWGAAETFCLHSAPPETGQEQL
ncbi:fibrocystin [Ctenodactylus gundi]